nr:acetyl-CoA synthetase [Streptomyces canus]
MSPTGGSPSGSAAARSPSAASCVSGRTEVLFSPGDAVVQRLCLRPGAVVSLVLEPRADDRRWTAVLSSAPAFVLASGWRVDADGTARASLRCAGTRGGTAQVTARAKAPDVAGAARVAFTLHVDVVPHPTQG